MDKICKNRQYYISQNGNDLNSGLSAENAWKTIKNVSADAAIIQAGDTVMFERGGIFRGSTRLTSGVTYSDYGKGAMPRLYGSLENYADASIWNKVSDNIWELDVGVMSDIGNIVFDHGKACGIKRLNDELQENHEFFHHIAEKKLYLYLKDENPAAKYADIEICSNNHVLWGQMHMNNIIIENLCIKYGGAHGICFCNDAQNITVRNCEIGYIGGSMLDETVRYGNGFEVVDNCCGILVENNYVYQCYDAGITHQSSYQPGCIQKNIVFRRNYIESCNYNIEYYVSAQNGFIQDTVYEENVLCNVGYGFGSTNRIGSDTSVLSHICCYVRQMPCKNFVIRNNIFDTSKKNLLTIGSPNDANGLGPVIAGNTYIQKVNPDCKTEMALVFDNSQKRIKSLTGQTQDEMEQAINSIDASSKFVRLVFNEPFRS